VVLVPIKGFERAKRRLAPTLDPFQRAALAKWMAAQVLKASRPLGVTVVCDDEEVAAWARDHSAAVAWTPGMNLNESLTGAISKVAESGIERAIVAHADLPFAHDLARFATDDPGEVVICPDRHGTGTNVMSVPTNAGLTLSYGSNSFQSHCAAAGERRLTVTVVEDPRLGWDVDEPEDLTPPSDLGRIPVLPAEAAAGKSA
jgi:2-phospho-L-lactate guanylyltransferase